MAKRKRSRFTPEFKAEVVLEALRGDSSQAELCRRHNLSEDQLSKWKQQVVENVATLFAPADKHANEASERIAQLEQQNVPEIHHSDQGVQYLSSDRTP